MRLAASLAIVGLVLATTHAAHADEASPEALESARRIFHEAVTLHDAGKLGPALERYREARKHASSPQLLFNIASCEEGLGHLLAAAAAFRETKEEAAKRSNDAIAAQASGRLLHLASAIPHVTLVVAADAPGVVVRLDDAVAEPNTRIEIDPGPHRVSATRDDGATFDLAFVARERDDQNVDILFGALSGAPPVIKERVVAPPWSRPSLAPAFVAGGVTLVLGTVAAITFGVGREKKNEYLRLNEGPTPGSGAARTELRSDGEALYNTSTAFAIGAALAGTAAGFFVLRSVLAKKPQAQATTWLVPAGLGASFGGTL